MKNYIRAFLFFVMCFVSFNCSSPIRERWEPNKEFIISYPGSQDKITIRDAVIRKFKDGSTFMVDLILENNGNKQKEYILDHFVLSDKSEKIYSPITNEYDVSLMNKKLNPGQIFEVKLHYYIPEPNEDVQYSFGYNENDEMRYYIDIKPFKQDYLTLQLYHLLIDNIANYYHGIYPLIDRSGYLKTHTSIDNANTFQIKRTASFAEYIFYFTSDNDIIASIYEGYTQYNSETKDKFIQKRKNFVDLLKKIFNNQGYNISELTEQDPDLISGFEANTGSIKCVVNLYDNLPGHPNELKLHVGVKQK